MRHGFLLVFALSLILGFQDSKPAAGESREEEWNKKLQTTCVLLAREHVSIAQFAAGKKLYLQARMEYSRAAALDATNADAAKGLEFELQKDQGSTDAKVEGIIQIDKKRKSLHAKAISSLTEIGKGAGAAKAGKRAWMQLLHYDPASKAAHAGLGHVARGKGWIDARRAALDDRRAKLLQTADGGQTYKTANPLEAGLGNSLTKIKSKHFDFVGTAGEAALRILVKQAEAGRAFILETLELKEEDLQPSIAGAFLVTKEEHQRFCAERGDWSAELKKSYGEGQASWITKPLGIEIYTNEAVNHRDDLYHRALGHLTMSYIIGDTGNAVVPLEEGFCYWITLQFFEGATTYCSTADHTSFGSQYCTTANFSEFARGAARDGGGLSIVKWEGMQTRDIPKEVLIKSWSFVDYCIRERPADFVKLLKQLRTGAPLARAICSAFAIKDPSDLDGPWREFVLEKY